MTRTISLADISPGCPGAAAKAGSPVSRRDDSEEPAARDTFTRVLGDVDEAMLALGKPQAHQRQYDTDPDRDRRTAPAKSPESVVVAGAVASGALAASLAEPFVDAGRGPAPVARADNAHKAAPQGPSRTVAGAAPPAPAACGEDTAATRQVAAAGVAGGRGGVAAPENDDEVGATVETGPTPLAEPSGQVPSRHAPAVEPPAVEGHVPVAEKGGPLHTPDLVAKGSDPPPVVTESWTTVGAQLYRPGELTTQQPQSRSGFVADNQVLTAALSKPMASGNGSYSITATLNPPSLGRVEAVVKVDGTAVSVSIVAHSTEGHGVIATHLDELRQVLSSDGAGVQLSLSDGGQGRGGEKPGAAAPQTTTDEDDDAVALAVAPLSKSGSLHVIL